MTIFDKQEQVSGYWGPATSSVDWCEENYKHSFYIAEFWNTISSFAMVVLGLLGILAHHKSLGWRLSNGYLMIVVVGIGSVLFHGTLQYEHQMWDEVPMVWTACYLLWVLLQENGYEPIRYGIGIALYCALATFATSQYKGSTQFYLFQTSFGIVMWSCLWFVWKLYKNVQNNQVIQLFHQGAQFLVLAIGVWLFDSNLCFVYDYVPNPQLHAWWHVLMCISLHFFFVATGFELMGTKKHRITYCANWIPYVQLVNDDDSKKVD
ncbi:alkaline phytoceramidase family protein [Absidia repens]|uniref:Alkaline phytoceramidase family protein n=1 Tax=Absidia repens TaxID=90262 RepID=A0A1X2IRQ2_9FUNG|nr:alkaline phytoceramidase family protein [Absidia repens]